MKANKKNKGKKFIEFDPNKLKGTITNTSVFDERNIKPSSDYETPLQTLTKTFPCFSLELIENVYEENNRNYFTTKKLLEEMSAKPEDDTKLKLALDGSLGDNSNHLENEPTTTNFTSTKEDKYDVIDINAFAKFRTYDDDPFIEDERTDNNIVINIEDLKKKNYFKVNVSSISDILSKQKKFSDEYQSVFSSHNDQPQVSNTATPGGEYSLEEMMLENYIEVLSKCFPNLTRTEITEKICEYDFDIDKLVLHLFDEKNDTMQNEEFTKLELEDISNKEELLSNLYSFDNKSMGNKIDVDAIFQHNLQAKIEKDIKKNTTLSKLKNEFNEKEFPFLSDEIKSEVLCSNNISDEYFLDKEIKDIQNKQIKSDLTKIVKAFPLVDEFEIKWVYYQYMDYYETYRYFNTNRNALNLTKHSIFNQSNEVKFSKGKQGNRSSNVKMSNTSNSNDDSVQSNVFYQIITERPENWKLEKSLNDQSTMQISDYESIRKKLIWQAQLCWRNGKVNDAKVIMAKARRYKQEINKMLLNKKISIFTRNNDMFSFNNLHSSSGQTIDLHGLSYAEAKLIVEKKIKDSFRMKDEGIIEATQRFVLTFITGVGHHSENNQAVLLPRLSFLIRTKMKLNAKVDEISGNIKVII